jgi:hypothetical protein
VCLASAKLLAQSPAISSLKRKKKEEEEKEKAKEKEKKQLLTHTQTFLSITGTWTNVTQPM